MAKTVIATLGLAPFGFVFSSSYDNAKPTIRRRLETELCQILTERLNQATTSAQPETNGSELDIVPRRKRGRPTSISVEAKQKALAARKFGAHEKEVAQLLYNLRRPTTCQVKDVSKVLKHYEQSLERAKS